MNRALVVVAIGIAAAAPALATKPQPTAAPQTKPEAIWRATCGYCHGSVPGAPELRGINLPEALIVTAARNGAPGMPAFHASEISDADLRALARWIARQPAPVKAAP
ncbi:cytochrome c [Novosphingobium sp. MMS21-SN21R]|uniref:c-type cytochrome n=1 Tax=Novosphingobium sp. MMS21-SN21R TaxID=2969298 RepID=UPI0028878B77|nr:cytochrome c [Novosphingobium sp. MMS21-SN21R]MDT0508543.1 cytochrome c [Novosphingobium sp. MMS21-SN21R]